MWAFAVLRWCCWWGVSRPSGTSVFSFGPPRGCAVSLVVLMPEVTSVPWWAAQAMATWRAVTPRDGLSGPVAIWAMRSAVAASCGAGSTRLRAAEPV